MTINHIEVWYHPHAFSIVCSRRQKYRGFVFSSKRSHAVNMITVLMGNEDGTDIGSCTADSLQALFGFFEREPKVNQNTRVSVFNKRTVTLTAAP
jgi:hypothetical protein